MTVQTVQTTTGLLPVTSVATECGVTAWTVRRWIRAGKLRAVKLPGGELRVAASDLAAVLTPVVPELA